jgi:hypothetical protein
MVVVVIEIIDCRKFFVHIPNTGDDGKVEQAMYNSKKAFVEERQDVLVMWRS